MRHPGDPDVGHLPYKEIPHLTRSKIHRLSSVNRGHSIYSETNRLLQKGLTAGHAEDVESFRP
jgi:hypothetical protein